MESTVPASLLATTAQTYWAQFVQEGILEELSEAGNKNSRHTVLVSWDSDGNQQGNSLQRQIK